ncbi:hypothetical protein HGO38_29695 [Rhizobium sp. CG5]|uniref:baseplate multidomain protein megatron n=1 Tax=Rhizobium sp. CG5 TaxID=2726076 RepID=UPI002033663A|nr:glycoside hydrolase/phage tail family protein [Rhizobium sp. CG5]MCM2477625.1 hypothetical protein [Rhizobium sp. CG5]
MATLLFQAAGAALGGIFGPVGAMIGRAAGALAGNTIDRSLIGGSTVSGSRLSTARIPGASEGTAINRLYGTARIGGTLIWATRFEEEVTTERSGSKASGSKVKTYNYFANIALGLCEGPVASVRRVWADGQEIDLTEVEMRFYRGSETQGPDPLIEAKQGEGRAPAYRGLAYVVFERLPLDTFGNRIPVLQFEVLRPVGRLERQIRAITLIPGATEHGYATTAVSEKTGEGSARIVNRNTLTATTDWQAALDELQALCPNLEHVALVVSWFGTDLRAEQCRIVPGVEVASRDSESRRWRVCGIARNAAHVVSQSNGGPAYGGTPDDASVIEAIADLKARGLKVFLYPFVMMDIPVGNGLPDPYGADEQASYPWRGRITCHPAPGRPGSPDRSAAIGAAVESFCGAAEAGDFTVSGTTVTFNGNDEGYRRLVLHYALLAQAAGGVDGFIIGSELRGLTTLRDGADGFPFVTRLGSLAEDVRAILGDTTQLTYGADWSEYFGYQPQDGSGDVYFHLDPLWANPAIDAVGIDNYMPLADWRDADLSMANPDGFRIADDVAAMRGQIAAGEGFDWYYASAADRDSRTRSAITDGLAGKPWVYRTKDIEGWWSNRHYDRSGGAESATPSAWLPRMKPVWLTELGCPAVDKGANQPNVFVDPKSAENALPYFSSGQRSDSMQRRFLEAHHGWWSGTQAPDGMVDPERIFVWTFDTRPYPAFPQDLDIWADGDNWRSGHWLNGRLGTATLADTISGILDDHGFQDYDVSAVSGDLGGYVQGEVTSARSLIEPLIDAFQIDVIEDGGTLVFRSRAKASLPATALAVLADRDDAPLWSETRGHDSDFAGEAILSFYDMAQDYEAGSARSRRVAAASSRVLSLDLPAVMTEAEALVAAEGRLRDHRIARRTVDLSIGPSELALQPGDVVTVADGPQGRFLVTKIEDGDLRQLALREFSAGVPTAVAETSSSRRSASRAAEAYAPVVRLLDLPRYQTGNETDFACAAVLSKPWRRTVLSSSAESEAYQTRLVLERPAVLGVLTQPLLPGVSGRFDRANTIEADLFHGELASASRLAVLNGANRLALRAANGAFEVIGFAQAQETAADHWQVSTLLRGLGGSEDAMRSGAVAGAEIVLLDAAVKPLGLSSQEAGLSLNWIAEAAGTGLPASGPFVFSGGTRARTPLAPVHLRGARGADGAIRLTWIRRGRIDADSWLQAEIPLDEEVERYRLRILDDGAIRRSIEVTEPAYLYDQTQEIADFGSLQPSLAVTVCQIGRGIAEGIEAQAVLTL